MPVKPEVIIERWPSQRMAKPELEAILSYLASKTSKQVRLQRYTGQLAYSHDTVEIYIPSPSTEPGPGFVTLYSNKLELDRNQRATPVSLDASSQILDEASTVLALVDRNCIIMLIDLTASDNEAGRVALAYICKKALELLEFTPEDSDEQLERLKEAMQSCYTEAFKNHTQERERELAVVEADCHRAYRELFEAERKKPILKAEIEAMKKSLSSWGDEGLDRQLSSIASMKETGLYEDVIFREDGGLEATTGEIAIEHDDFEFPLGRYRVEVASDGQVLITNLDSHPRASHPHPHVGTDFRPCLGTAAADLAQLIGRTRFAEALQLIHNFLCSYNPENPFEKISRFDPTGMYEDPNENPCEDCDDRCSPYCVNSCSENDGYFSCSDCCYFRTEYCFTDCEYNEGFDLIHPCDDCSKVATPYCHLHCPFNSEWDLQNPCDGCDMESCQEDCPYRTKKEEVGYEVEEKPVSPQVSQGT